MGLDRSTVRSAWGQQETYSYEVVVDTYLAEACVLREFCLRASSSGISIALSVSSVMPGGSAEDMGRRGPMEVDVVGCANVDAVIVRIVGEERM